MSIVIGTAGWTIPAANRAAFAAEGSALERYGQRLPGVEVNSSFHRPHRRTTWERWAASVPPGFGFAVKLPKEISHIRRLQDAGEPMSAFLDQVAGLGPSLKILLLQLPPKLAFDAAVAEAFLRGLRERTPVQLVCEPRHPGWFEPAAEALFEEFEVARVVADPAPVPAASMPGGWRGLTYLRLHGSPVMYRSSYDDARLGSYAALLAVERRAGRPAWCIFDNTASSAAMGDALRLEAMLATRA